MSSKKVDIRSLSKEELTLFSTSHGAESFRGQQVFQWLWDKGVQSFDEMTNLSKPFRQLLQENFVINSAQVHKCQKSVDGTIKNAIKLHDGLFVESVLIPMAKHTTACVSSQVGCSLDCMFCATSKLKRMRNLTHDEIYDQVVIMDKQSKTHCGMPLKNLVFMGMGEPLMNYNNVISAIDRIITSKELQINPKKVTLSTSGIPKMIMKMADDGVKFKLAVSLHSAIDSKRASIMPFSKAFPIKELEKALMYWYSKTKSRITYEYVVWNEINDTERDIEALVKFCKKVPCKVNIIMYNSIGDSTFKQARDLVLKSYISALDKIGVVAKIRASRGLDIDAACGQLANKVSA